MTYLAKAEYLNDEQISADILAIPATGFKPNPNNGRVWAPKGVTWHNTGAPSIGQWNTYSDAQKSAWGDNLNNYYRGMGWHAGPHAVGTPAGYAIKLGDWQADGIHASCWNADHFGIETVGNFCTGGDDPLSGEGLAAMKSSANVIAALCVRFGWEPRAAVNFHRECEADHHSCPGDRVSDEFAWGLVEARIAEIKGTTPAASQAAPTPAAPPAPAPVVAPAATTEPATSIPSWAPASNSVWVRVAQMINAVRAKGAANPLVIATVVNAYHESAVTPKIVGDEGTAFGPWQHHFNPRGARILAGCGVDVRSETSIAKLVDALWWELENVFGASLAKMKAAATGAEATGIFETDIEGAGAAGALSRRVADAGPLEVWISQNESFIAANPAA